MSPCQIIGIRSVHMAITRYTIPPVVLPLCNAHKCRLVATDAKDVTCRRCLEKLGIIKRAKPMPKEALI